MRQQSQSETTTAKAVENHVGGKYALNYFTHLDEELGFVYFSAPAVANTRTVGSLNIAVAEALGIDYTLDNLGKLYNRESTVVAPPERVGIDVFDQMLEDPDVVKFTFFRDPVERFAALYRNVFSINTMGSEPRKKLFKHLAMPLEENLTMLDLAELLCEEEDLKPLFPQTRTQRQMTAFDIVDYDFIGRHESWETDFTRISNDIFGRSVAHFDPIQRFNKDPEGVKLRGNVDEETASAIREAYREDYEMLDEITELFPDGFVLQE